MNLAPDVIQKIQEYARQLIDLKAEKKDISDREKEVKAYAKSDSIDVKMLLKAVSLLEKPQHELDEQEHVLQAYMSALRP